MGNGTIADPWTLAEALASNRIGANDTIYLRAGTYSGDFVCQNAGEADNYVTFQAYPGERAIIDGSLEISGDYIQWQDIEFTDSSFTDRESAETSSDPSDIGGKKVVKITGTATGVRLVNCHITNGRQGVFTEASTVGLEIYGCLIYHNGWKQPDHNALGHGLYLQNEEPTAKLIKDCILFDQFGYGFHIYGSAGAIDDFTLRGNTVFDSGSLWGAGVRFWNMHIGGQGAFKNPIVENNHTYMSAEDTGNRIGYGTGNPVTGAIINNNVLHGNTALKLTECVPDQFANNLIYGNRSGFVDGDYPTNTYGVYASVPDATYLRANTYDSDRANLTIYNKQAQANTVAVDVSSVFNAGDSITARNVQDYWTDTQSLTVAGDGMLTVNMEAVNRSVAAPVGWDAPATTFPSFGAFVLERT